MDRPKRPIMKPNRYQTTSSEEAPRKKTMESRNDKFTMENDMRELRGVLEENSSNNNYYNLSSIHTQLQTTHTYTTSSSTHTLSQTPYTYTTSSTHTQSQTPYAHTNSSACLQPLIPHERIPQQASTHTESYSFNMTPTYIQPTSTHSSQVDNQLHTYNMDINTHDKFQVQCTDRRYNALQSGEKDIQNR